MTRISQLSITLALASAVAASVSMAHAAVLTVRPVISVVLPKPTVPVVAPKITVPVVHPTFLLPKPTVWTRIQPSAQYALVLAAAAKAQAAKNALAAAKYNAEIHPVTQPQQPAPSKPAASSGTTFTPTSYPEIKDAYGAPMGYNTPQGPVYFPNGQMPLGYSVGPNNTIETNIKS